MRDWSDLNSEILELIASLLLKSTFIDCGRFGSVCKSWRSVVQDMPSSLVTDQIPWLLRNSPKDSRFSLLNISNRNKFYLDQPSECGKRFCSGSSHGWLLMVDEESPISILLHPITREQVHIPPVTALPQVIACPPRSHHYALKSIGPRPFCLPAAQFPNWIARSLVKKIVMSSSSLNNNNCLIMVLSYGLNGLVCCKPGDTTWTTVVDDNNCQYNDLAYWKGEFYVVDDRGGLVIVSDLDTSPRVKQISSPPSSLKPITSRITSEKGVYQLVESSGELLLVRRHSELFHLKPTDPHLNSVPFQVFKRDPFKQDWLEVKGLGNHTLFWSPQSSVSLLSSNYPGLRPNCIYFISPGAFNKCRIYNVEGDGSFESSHLDNLEETCLQPVWITPSLY